MKIEICVRSIRTARWPNAGSSAAAQRKLGWINASYRGMPVTVFGLIRAPQLVGTHAAAWRWTGDIHNLVAEYAILPLVGLHVAAALYHYFIRCDRVLQRMLPGV